MQHRHILKKEPRRDKKQQNRQVGLDGPVEAYHGTGRVDDFAHRNVLLLHRTCDEGRG